MQHFHFYLFAFYLDGFASDHLSKHNDTFDRQSVNISNPDHHKFHFTFINACVDFSIDKCVDIDVIFTSITFGRFSLLAHER